MYSFSWFWGCFSFTLAFVVGTLLIAYKLPKKNKWWLRFWLCMLGFLAFLFIYRAIIYSLNGVVDDTILYAVFGLSVYTVQYVLMVITLKICFKISIWTSLFCATAGYSIQHLSQRTYQIIENICFPDQRLYLWIPLLTLITAIFYVGFYYAFVKKIDYSLFDELVDHKMQLVITAFVAMVSIYMNALISNYANGSPHSTEIVIIDFILSMMFSVVILFLELALVNGRKANLEVERLSSLLKEEKIQYEQEKATMDLLNVKYHDIKHLLNTLDEGQYSVVLPEIKKTLNFYENIVKTGNEAADLVISKKVQYCSNNNIKFTCMLDCSKLEFITTYEMFTLFDNALNNAIHAVEKCEGEKRIIKISQIFKDGFTEITISNYFTGNLILKNGLPQTKEDNKDYHGFGVRSIQMLAEKYDGSMSVEIIDDTFNLHIFLPISL